MKKLAIAALIAAPLALTGCQSIVNELTGQSLVAKCNRASVVYATFVASGEGSAETKAKARSVWNEVAKFCSDPDSVNEQNLSIKIAELYAALKAASK